MTDPARGGGGEPAEDVSPVGATRGREEWTVPPMLARDALDAAWRAASDRVLFLDYDGTLAEFTLRPEDARPEPELIGALTRVANAAGVEAWIISGRTADRLGEWLGATGIGIVAEHGAKVRPHGALQFRDAVEPPSEARRAAVRGLFQRHVERVPGSHVEEKSVGLVWHFRGAEPDASARAASALLHELEVELAGTGLEALAGDHVVEVRPYGVSKGRAALAILAERGRAPDLLIAAGDDITDESLFADLPRGATTILVGERASGASARLPDPAAMRSLVRHWERLTTA